MFHNLQLLRALAALGVVYYHITSDGGLRLAWDVGRCGVDIFFVISGFIISSIGVSRPRQFLRRRLERIVPPYWAATLAVYIAASAAPQLFRSTRPDAEHLLWSLLFVPHVNATDGETLPTFALGWTLNFEMAFYAVFALALALPARWARRAPLLSALAVMAAMLGIRASGTTDAALQFYGRPVVLEFCYGVAVYYLVQACTARAQALRAWAPLKPLLLLTLAAGVVAIVLFDKHHGDTGQRHLHAGLPAAAIVLSALLLERLHGLGARWRVAGWLGEASYLIYLVHPWIVFPVLRLGVGQATLTLPAMVALIVLLLLLTCAVSCALHRWLERPLLAWLRARRWPASAAGAAGSRDRRSGCRLGRLPPP